MGLKQTYYNIEDFYLNMIWQYRTIYEEIELLNSVKPYLEEALKAEEELDKAIRENNKSKIREAKKSLKNNKKYSIKQIENTKKIDKRINAIIRQIETRDIWRNRKRKEVRIIKKAERFIEKDMIKARSHIQNALVHAEKDNFRKSLYYINLALDYLIKGEKIIRELKK